VTEWRAAPALALLLAAFAGAHTPSDTAHHTCGRSDGIGAFYDAHIGADTTFTLTLNLTDSPHAPLALQPLLFVDGVLQVGEDATAITLPCGEAQTWRHPLAHAHTIVHWSLAPLPWIDPLLAGLDLEHVWRTFAEQPLPQREGWVSVNPIRMRDAPTAPITRQQPLWGFPPIATATRYGGHADVWEDGIVWIADGTQPVVNVTAEGTLARAKVGGQQPFMVRFLPGRLGAGAVALTCLLNGIQIPAFEGALLAPAVARAGEAVRWLGSVTVASPGWQRLHCYLLPEVTSGEAWPRPLMAAYLWGDP
jgi:hypothetical protein